VSGDTLDRKREWRDTPPLDRFSAGCRWDANKSNAIRSPGEEEVSAKSPDGPPSRKKFWRQLVNALHRAPCIRPLVYVFLVCFLTLSEIARNGRVIDQTGSEELASVLKGGRMTNIPEVPTDLRQISRVKTIPHGIGNNSTYRFHLDDILAG